MTTGDVVCSMRFSLIKVCLSKFQLLQVPTIPHNSLPTFPQLCDTYTHHCNLSKFLHWCWNVIKSTDITVYPYLHIYMLFTYLYHISINYTSPNNYILYIYYTYYIIFLVLIIEYITIIKICMYDYN